MSLSEQELRALAAEAESFDADFWTTPRERLIPEVERLTYVQRAYMQGVLAGRAAKHATAAEGEGRDGLARKLAQALEAHRDYVAALWKHKTLDGVEALALTDELLAEASALGLLGGPAASPAQQPVPLTYDGRYSDDRKSLALEIRSTLKARGHWCPETDGEDLIMAVGLALDKAADGPGASPAGQADQGSPEYEAAALRDSFEGRR